MVLHLQLAKKLQVVLQANRPLESISATTSKSVSSISVASPGVVTCGGNHFLKDGMQVKFTSPNF